jgi:thymidylate synthase
MHADYTGQGFDQLLDVIDKIKNNPNDRRIIISAWNPSDLKLMALPPCHMFAQVCGNLMFLLSKPFSLSSINPDFIFSST